MFNCISWTDVQLDIQVHGGLRQAANLIGLTFHKRQKVGLDRHLRYLTQLLQHFPPARRPPYPLKLGE